jgi:hypothetical protein
VILTDTKSLKINTELLSDDIWSRISDLARVSKRRYVAVAYVASVGIKMLRLGKGDILVVDMSEARVKAGGTNPSLIKEYLDKGVEVYSLRRLHAKVFVFDQTAVIGSTNVSSHSRDVLTEAALLTTEPSIVEGCRLFVQDLASSLTAVDNEYLAKCQKLYRPPIWEPGAGIPEPKAVGDWAYSVMKEIIPLVPNRPQHGYFIPLSKKSDSVRTAYLSLQDDKTGVGTAQLRLHPGDDIEQGKSFYRSVDPRRFKDLRLNDWTVTPNFHFGGPYGGGWPPYITDPPMGLSKYIEFWRANLQDIRQLSSSDLVRQLRIFQNKGLIPKGRYKAEFARLRSFKKVSIRAGVSLTYKWPPFVDKLPDPRNFAPKLRAKIEEAMRTWGDTFS